MKINPIGITRTVSKEEHMWQPYKDMAELGYNHIKERVLKDGSRILLGYEGGKKLASIANKITPDNWLQKQK